MRAFFAFAIAAAACGGGASPPPAKPVATTPPPRATEPAPPVEPTSAAEPTPPAEPLPPTPLSDAEFEAMMREMIEMFVALGTAIDAAGSNCAEAGAGIETVMAERSHLVQRMKRIDQDPVVGDKATQWLKDHMAELMAPAMKLAAVAQTCADDARFAEAMKRLDASR